MRSHGLKKKINKSQQKCRNCCTERSKNAGLSVQQFFYVTYLSNAALVTSAQF
jgi:hypothetical protein